MEFSNEFFEETESYGFTVSSEMKSVWAAQIEVLLEIDNICKKNGLTWYAAFGTLLGAVRHKGFIPWDDDLDIWMKREEYNKLLQILPEQLVGDYKYLHYTNNKKYDQYFLRIINSDKIRIDKEWLKKFHNCPFSVGVDIFPLDNISDNIEEREFQKSVANIIYSAINIMENKKIYEESEKSRDLILKIEKMLNVSLNWNGYSKNELWSLCDKIFSLYADDNTAYMTDFSGYCLYSRLEQYDRKWFDKVVMTDFENIKIPIPNGYDELLTEIFGNWREPVKNMSAHGYPYYKGQREKLVEFLIENNREDIIDKLRLSIDF